MEKSNGSVGFINTFFELDSTNWLIQSDFTNTDHYIISWDQVEFGVSNDSYCINSRYDSERNNYVRVGQLNSYQNDRWFFCGVNPIAAFGWGNNNINDCTIKDSYFSCLNIVNSEIYGVEMSNYSYLFDTEIKNSYIESLSFTNESGIFSLVLNNCSLKNCKFSNNSQMNGEFHDSTIEYLDLCNNSYVNINEFYNSTLGNLNINNSSYMSSISASASYLQYLTLNNQSGMESLSLKSESYLSNLSMTNVSSLYGSTLTNSSLEQIDFTSGYIYNLQLNNSYIENLDIKSSDLYNINSTDGYLSHISIDRSSFSSIYLNNSGLVQIELSGSYLNLSTLGSQSNFPSGTTFRYNELKYQFPFTFNGATGSGLTDNDLSTPTMLIPQDFYIDKVVIESTNITYAGLPATFSLRIPISPSELAFELEVSAADMGGIKVFDISNGSITGAKVDSNSELTTFLKGGTSITSGGIKMEITIKNTRYYYD